jgi:hypothetical protein
MSKKYNAPLPDNLDLDDGYTIAFTAVDAASGAPVTTVKISGATLIVTQLSPGTAEDLSSGPFMLVPGPEA